VKRITKRMLIGLATMVVTMSGALLGQTTVTHAAAVTQCTQTESWVFSPALGLGGSGGWSFNWPSGLVGHTCLQANTSGAVGLDFSGGGISGTYNGSCLSASLVTTTGTPGLLIGGTVAIFTPSNGTHYHVLATLVPCFESSAIGVSGSTFDN